MDVILKRGKESFEILLGQSTLCNLLTASVINHHFHLFDRNVAILVDVCNVAQVCFKSILRLELVLEEPVYLDELPLNTVELVSWDFLRIKYNHVVIKDIALNEGSEI